MESWKNELDKLRYLPKGAKFVFMYSGGKDTGLALSMALEQGEAIELIHCVDETNGESLFHEQQKEVMDEQARLLNVPIRYVSYKWWVRWDKLARLYKAYKKQGVEYVVFGDLNSEGNVDVQIKICQSAGITPCFPLYLIPYEQLMDELESRNIQSIITTINHPAISSRWLGKVFDRKTYKIFSEYGIDSFGEGGEFHTTLIAADCFRREMKYEVKVLDERKIQIYVQKD